MTDGSHQRALITGATGFLGGALARRLLAAGASVRIVARSRPRAQALERLGAQVVIADLHDERALTHALAGCTHVYHNAALLNGPYAAQAGVNIGGTRALMAACAAAIGGGTAAIERIVHVSSIAVYGYAQRRALRESVPALPGADPYSITKAGAEAAAFEWAGSHALPLSIIRPGGIYGAGAGLWTRTLFQLATARVTPWPGDGRGRAPYIHADDVVSQMIVQAEHPGALGGVFNSTNDPAPTYRDILTAYAGLAGRSPRWLAVPPAVFAAAGALAALGAPRISFRRDLIELAGYAQREHGYPMDKARALLGWSPAVTLEDGVAQCAPWLRSEGLLR